MPDANELLAYIRNNPGQTFSEIKSGLGVEGGDRNVLKPELMNLHNKQNLIENDGGEPSRWYVVGQLPTELPFSVIRVVKIVEDYMKVVLVYSDGSEKEFPLTVESQVDFCAPNGCVKGDIIPPDPVKIASLILTPVDSRGVKCGESEKIFIPEGMIPVFRPLA